MCMRRQHAAHAASQARRTGRTHSFQLSSRIRHMQRRMLQEQHLPQARPAISIFFNHCRSCNSYMRRHTLHSQHRKLGVPATTIVFNYHRPYYKSNDTRRIRSIPGSTSQINSFQLSLPAQYAQRHMLHTQAYQARLATPVAANYHCAYNACNDTCCTRYILGTASHDQ